MCFNEHLNNFLVSMPVTLIVPIKVSGTTSIKHTPLLELFVEETIARGRVSRLPPRPSHPAGRAACLQGLGHRLPCPPKAGGQNQNWALCGVRRVLQRVWRVHGVGGGQARAAFLLALWKPRTAEAPPAGEASRPQALSAAQRTAPPGSGSLPSHLSGPVSQ